MELGSIVMGRYHRTRRQRRCPLNTIRCITILGAKRRTCKGSGSVNVANGTVVYDEPPESFDLPHLLPNVTLKLFDSSRHRHTIIFIPFGDGADVLLKLDILSALVGKSSLQLLNGYIRRHVRVRPARPWRGRIIRLGDRIARNHKVGRDR